MSRNEEALQAIIDGDDSSKLEPAQSRNERILHAIIDDEDLSKLPAPQSPIESLLIQVGEKIQQGGGGLSAEPLSVTENGEYTAPSGKAYTPVTVNVSGGGGGGSVPESDVNFIDYDGTVVAAYTAAEFAALSAMPANPDRTSEGLTAQGWNWTLEDAKACVAECGQLTIGQMYITTDGKTRIYIHLEEGRTSPMLILGLQGTVTVNWGDGNSEELVGTGGNISKSHDYSHTGDYCITIEADAGASCAIVGDSTTNIYSKLITFADGASVQNRHYQCGVKSVLIGRGVESIGSHAFGRCSGLEKINMPSGLNSIGEYAFSYCASLKALVIPTNTTVTTNDLFISAYSKKHTSLNKKTTAIGDRAFQNNNMDSVSIHSSVTSIGDAVFRYNFRLAKIVIPSSVTSIGVNAFADCNGLAEIHFRKSTPPTVSNSNAFSNLPSDCKIYVPTGSRSAYTSATNYPSSSTYTYIEE